ncbi:hypothetical protein [Cellvibrio sp. OA-2007]|uniref:hypothetical protein n=1 Tax=Cellvibrio sp. OA-2007 TaxID=529823 RepID=UPI000781F07F|nr:hypothetical protein [Cellvibrio sp. OA-2007]
MKFVNADKRVWLVRWLYGVALGHLAAGIVMTWWAESPWLAYYHQQAVASFKLAEPSQLIGLQHWWFQLFGATLQAFSLFMLLLVYLGNRYADSLIWLVLGFAILWWAPQDIVISLRQSMWSHLWVDLGAIVAIVPAAICLALIDRRVGR